MRTTVALMLVLPLLAGCEVAARERRVEPPQLWRAEALAPDGSVAGAVRVCADLRIREGLMRPLPAAGAELCLREIETHQARPNGYSEICSLRGVRYRVDVDVTGEPTRDFSVAMQMTAQNPSGVRFAQVRRYQRLGQCPPGWKIGDSDKPGEGRRPNAYS